MGGAGYLPDPVFKLGAPFKKGHEEIPVRHLFGEDGKNPKTKKGQKSC